ncbi:MAG: sugar transporter [Flavobacteriaceae bacterium]|uniref:polysaccharide biosynthesis/export family protein n=1 Tax=Winogradskyella poriferorum TaxID=307627 RepID=UPI000C48B28E|nr:sugar transporter [Flavobacteriaceae bacterium]MBD10689.1 sugar transporter [Flavobacteriaceae bacterium]|tara:strand:- start:26172 stop:26972 length:801 start_codon:yes stop_codon:yes gene_type:complete
MRSIKLLIIALSCIFISSCIPHKDTIYLQNKGNAVNDTIPYNLSEVQKPYRIQIDDILNIRIKVLDQNNTQIFNPIGEANLNADSAERAYFDGFTVDIHGNIRIPNLGILNVLGYTVEEIEKLIEQKLLDEQFKETANIFVTVKLAGLRYTATGEIGNPGTITLFKERVNIFEAIANAGEIPLTGNRKEVMIIRQYPQGQKIHSLDLTDVNVMKSPYYYIQPNDMIYVKPLKQKSIGTGETAVSSISTIATIVSLAATTVLIFTRL